MKYLEESDGNQSAMRLMCFMSLCMSFVCAAGTLFTPIDKSTGLTLTGMFLGAAFGGKTFQKFAETKANA